MPVKQKTGVFSCPKQNSVSAPTPHSFLESSILPPREELLNTFMLAPPPVTACAFLFKQILETLVILSIFQLR